MGDPRCRPLCPTDIGISQDCQSTFFLIEPLKTIALLFFFFVVFFHQEIPFNYFLSPKLILLCVKFPPADTFADELTFLSSNRTLREVNKIWETTLPCLYFSQITVMLNELLLIIHCSRIWFTFSELLQKRKGVQLLSVILQSWWIAPRLLSRRSSELDCQRRFPTSSLPFASCHPEYNTSMPCASSPDTGGDKSKRQLPVYLPIIRKREAFYPLMDTFN